MSDLKPCPCCGDVAVRVMVTMTDAERAVIEAAEAFVNEALTDEPGPENMRLFTALAGSVLALQNLKQ